MSNWKPNPNGYFKPDNQSANTDVPKPGDTVEDIEINTIGHAGTNDKYSRVDHAHTITGAASEADLYNLAIKVNNKENVGVAQSLVDTHNSDGSAHTEIMAMKTDKTYVDAQVSIRPGDNILINTDFKNPINQRGTPYDTSLPTNGYRVDRWKNYYANFTLSLTGEGLRITPQGTSISFSQYVENPTRYTGKTITVSATVRMKSSMTTNFSVVVGDGVSASMYMNIGNPAYGGNSAAALAEEWVTLSGSFKVNDNPSSLGATLWTGNAEF